MSGIIAATRPIRRDMFSNPGRLIAAVLLIALPVAFFFGSFIFSESTSPNFVDQSKTRDITFDWSEMENFPTKEEMTQALPDGLQPDVHISTTGDFYTDKGQSQSGGYLDQYPTSVLDSQLPVIPQKGEVIISVDMFKTLEVNIGDTVGFDSLEPVSPAAAGKKHNLELKVVGFTPGYSSLVGQGTLGTADDFYGKSADSSIDWLTTGPVKDGTANKLVYVGNHPDSADYFSGYRLEDLPLMISLVLISLTQMLLIFLFLSPAVSLALSRHTRMFALMAAQGASRRHIAFAVLCFALFAGLIGATLGLILGYVTSWIIFSLRYPGWPLQVEWQFAAFLWLTATVGFVVAAFIPAYLAGKSSLSGAMLGRTPDRMVRWRRWMSIGPLGLVILTVLGFIFSRPAVASYLDSWGGSALGIIAFLALICLTLSAPALLFCFGKLPQSFPISLRTAAKGLTRKSMHAIPAAAAFLAVASIITALSADDATSQAYSAKVAKLELPANVAFLSADNEQAVEESAKLLAPELGAGKKVSLTGILSEDYFDQEFWYDIYSPDAISCDYARVGSGDYLGSQYRDELGRDPLKDETAAKACLATMTSGSTYYNSARLSSRYLVGGTELLDLVNFEDDSYRQQAATTLENGGIVVPRGSGFLDKKKATFTIRENTEDGKEFDFKDISSATLPVSESMSPFSTDIWLLSPQAAKALKAETAFVGAAFIYENPISTEQANRISERNEQVRQEIVKTQLGTSPDSTELAADTVAGISISSASVNSFWEKVFLPAVLFVLVIIAMLLVIALSAPGLRKEALTLISIGATSQFAAKMAAWQTFLLSAGSLITGFIVGQVATLVESIRAQYTAAGDAYHLGTLGSYQISWNVLAAIALSVLISTGLSWVVHRVLIRDTAELNRDEMSSRMLA